MQGFFLRNLISGIFYILIVRIHELFKKCKISCLDLPFFTVITEAQQNIYEKIQFWCDIRVHWFGTEQEFRNRYELISEKIYIQFYNSLFMNTVTDNSILHV